MKKSLMTRGNTWAILIPKELIGLLRINPEETFLNFKIKNKILYIEKISQSHPDFKNGLIKKLSRVNTSWCLNLSNSVVELLEINPEIDKIDIEINDDILIIKKAL